ncbi:MAG: GlsB/YeaQ/YmgE family stress response membrane protein [Candidatus Dormibacteraeota bacterium]|nr:GlsB/YeaQ/YmgE family stress response membrane protein [Candidatus Dormibacteraeota bacterium]
MNLGAVTITIDPVAVLVWIIIGLVAGFLASRVMLGHGMGLIADIAVGIVGAVAGGLIANALGVTVSVAGHPIISEIIVAFVGAMVLLLALRLVGVGRRRRFLR